ncbi:MAG: aminoacyl-tRNA hydrolase [Sphaerochaetaceae bacterium]|nr:aminoacyl-tRNA hydrolase [Sphaerochaetaceae bacterium]
MIRLIVFLGNKGSQYTQTRHNMGWIFLEAFLKETSLPNWQEKFHGQFGRVTIAEREILILKPMTFMNESGRSVGAMSRYFGIEPSEILVVHDDIELDFLTIKLQLGGGLAGHNGLKSIRQDIGIHDFFRLKLGIGRPERGSVASYVLGRFSEIQQAQLSLICDKALLLMHSWFLQGCPTETLPQTVKVGL